MYAIRVGAGGEVLEAVFSADVPAAEALRALSQASVLAEAGGIAHAFCDVREVDGGLTHGSLQVIAASFHGRSAPDQRVAVVCNQRQLPLARHFARLAHAGEEFGVFTREADARAWLESVRATSLAETALRHMKAIMSAADPVPAVSVGRRNSA